jgi:hypothetical protein
MSITSLADRLVTVYRRTSLVLDAATAAASHSASRQPSSASKIEVLLAGGAAATGTVTVLGTVNGSPDSEVLTFTGPTRKSTIKRFTALATPAFTTTGLADESPAPTISASAIGGDGSAIEQPVLVVSAWPMRKDAGTASWPTRQFGSAEIEETRFYFDYTTVWTPRDGDVFVDDRTSEEWQVIGHPTQHGGGSTVPHHYEIRVKRREGSRAA